MKKKNAAAEKRFPPRGERGGNNPAAVKVSNSYEGKKSIVRGTLVEVRGRGVKKSYRKKSREKSLLPRSKGKNEPHESKGSALKGGRPKRTKRDGGPYGGGPA